MLELSKKYLKMDILEFSVEDVEKLQEIIKYHCDLYYNKEEPVISDFEYDELFKKLQILENNFWINLKLSNKVWVEILESTFKKVKHSRPMISLDNTYNEEDLNNFDERVRKNINSLDNQNKLFNILKDKEQEELSNIEYTLEFKFDWLWIELIYDNWELIQAITRWNWLEWEDVTINVMQIDNIPKKIPYKNYLEVRGEVVMPISVFQEINEIAKKEWTKIFSNPRNAASWSLRIKDSSLTKKRKLQFFAYDLTNFDEFVKFLNFNYLSNSDSIEHFKIEKTYFYIINNLEKLGFSISSYFKKLNWINEVIDAIEKFWNIKKTIDFEIDWLVLKVNNILLWQYIWTTDHHPKYAIAYKFPAEILTTKVLSIEHSVWKTWTITPVANLEPINIAWVIVKRATLHNYEEIENLDVRIWDTVFIKRAWEVIPKIISVVKQWSRDNLEKICPPKFCPSCQTELRKDKDKVRYYCPNEIDCPAKNHEKLTFAVGKQWFNIDGFWEKQVELFLNEGIIHNIVDVFKISEKKDEILFLEWFQNKSVNNLILSVEKAKKVSINTLLTALWISWVGKKTAKTISKLFKNSQDLINFSYNLEDLEQLEDVWPEIAKNVINYFNNNAHKILLKELINILNIEYYEKKEILNNSIFNWKKVCITWSFEWYSRDQLIKKIELVGWYFVTSVTKNTDYLLLWDNSWSKFKKANELGIKIISLKEFLNLYEL